MGAGWEVIPVSQVGYGYGIVCTGQYGSIFVPGTEQYRYMYRCPNAAKMLSYNIHIPVHSITYRSELGSRFSPQAGRRLTPVPARDGAAHDERI